jgi:signal transduction histidine kinase
MRDAVGTLIARVGRGVEPTWVGPLMLVAAVLHGLLALVIEGGRYDRGAALGNITPLSAALASAYVLAWIWELLAPPRPRWIFAIAALAPASGLLYGGRDTLAPLLCMLVGWWIAYTGTRREAIVGLALVLVSIAPTFVAGRGEYDNWLTWSLGGIFCWISGLVLALQRRTLATLRAAQADLARQAAAEERRLLARELHDVVAHTLAVTMLHLTGARHVLQRDPARAAEALAQAEELGRQSLADLRRAVGLLADGTPAGRAAPALGAHDIPALAAEFVRAGMPLETAISGSLDDVPAGLGLDLYRMVQEALANAAKHAPGQRVHLQLTVGHREIALLVRNAVARREARPDTSDGHGLPGLRARAARHGGEVVIGDDGSSWQVVARFPLASAPAEAAEALP